MNVSDVLADLTAKPDDLDALVDNLSNDDLMQPTASPGWSVADQIAHLTYFDRAAAIARAKALAAARDGDSAASTQLAGAAMEALFDGF